MGRCQRWKKKTLTSILTVGGLPSLGIDERPWCPYGVYRARHLDEGEEGFSTPRGLLERPAVLSDE